MASLLRTDLKDADRRKALPDVLRELSRQPQTLEQRSMLYEALPYPHAARQAPEMIRYVTNGGTIDDELLGDQVGFMDCVADLVSASSGLEDSALLYCIGAELWRALKLMKRNRDYVLEDLVEHCVGSQTIHKWPWFAGTWFAGLDQTQKGTFKNRRTLDEGQTKELREDIAAFLFSNPYGGGYGAGSGIRDTTGNQGYRMYR